MNNFTQFLNHYSKYVLKKEHKHLVLHVTNHCNFRCAHCFVDFETIKKDQKKITSLKLQINSKIYYGLILVEVNHF